MRLRKEFSMKYGWTTFYDHPGYSADRRIGCVSVSPVFKERLAIVLLGGDIGIFDGHGRPPNFLPVMAR